MTSEFDRLFKSMQKAYPEKQGKQQQADTRVLWSKIKEECGKDKTAIEKRAAAECMKLEDIAFRRKAKLTSMFCSATAKSTETSNLSTSEAKIVEGTFSVPTCTEIDPLFVPVNDAEPSCTKQFRTPAQDTLLASISSLNNDIVVLCAKKETKWGLSKEEEQELKQKKQKANELNKNLKRRQYKTKKCQEYREQKKRNLEELIAENPDIGKKLKVHPIVGRSCLEESQPMLLQTIVNIVTHGSAADGKRRSELYNSCRTLDELTCELDRQGYKISRSGTYLRLLPRKSTTHEGKRHIRTVPVKLCRAMNDSHVVHPDTNFSKATIRNLEELSSTLGPGSVMFLSQDDKARVPIGLPAAKCQTPFLMHLEYRVKLPDHDWVVGDKHKLIPSVYALCEIQPQMIGKEAVNYSGPTYISVRSGKHSSSTAYSHGYDLQRLLNLSEFSSFTRDCMGNIKPVWVLTVDGGPDENPRYEKVVQVCVHHFVCFNLDAVFVACNAPGRSAYNRVERRMAPLSRMLAGVILPHEHYGSHLNEKGQTVDEEMEKCNFEFAGKTLAELWNGHEIDGHQVTAEFTSETGVFCVNDITQKDSQWYSVHVQESQYCLQIVKCDEELCCGKWRSGIRMVLKDRFLPPPLLVLQKEHTLVCPDINNSSDKVTGQFVPLYHSMLLGDKLLQSVARCFKKPPFDMYCPTVVSQLSQRCCSHCGKYHGSRKSTIRHENWCRQLKQSVAKTRPVRIAAQRQRELMVVVKNALGFEDCEWQDEELIDISGHNIPTQSTPKMCILPVEQSLQPVWEEITT